MSWKCLQKVSATALPVMYLLFVVVSSVGILYMGAQMGHGGHVHDCPFAKSLAMCDMTPAEHLSAWKSVFSTLGLKEVSLLAVFAFLAFFATQALFRYGRLRHTVYRQLRISYSLEIRPFVRSLEQAFSDGILHSKAY